MSFLINIKTAEQLAADQAAKEQQAARAALLAELAAIDTATVRPLRAVLAGSGTDADKERLAELEAKAEEIRAKLA